jgi:cytidylate kinase
MNKTIKVAIDGPVGAGKSTVAKMIAKKMNIIYVDTGAMYRTVGLYAIRKGVPTTDAESLKSLINEVDIDVEIKNGEQLIYLNKEDVTGLIRTPEISMAASNVSAVPEVRVKLVDMQRKLAESKSVIMDGRDIGTVILPDAEVKIFLTASPEARAKRRYDELISKGKDVTYEEVYDAMVERDHNDTNRTIAPCVPAEDAIILDNSDFDPSETAREVVRIIRDKQKAIDSYISSNVVANTSDSAKEVASCENNFYMKAHKVLAPLFRWIMRLRPHGLENIPQDGGIIFCANHIGALDVISIAACTTRQITFVAKKELFSIPSLPYIDIIL